MRKRVRSSVNIDSLSPSQIAILSEAAAILQVSDLANLPKALGDLPSRIGMDNESPEQTYALPAMNARQTQSTRTQATNPKARAQSQFRSTMAPVSTAREICDLQSFSLGLIPKQIEDCFASFNSPSPRHAFPADSQGTRAYLTQDQILTPG